MRTTWNLHGEQKFCGKKSGDKNHLHKAERAKRRWGRWLCGKGWSEEDKEIGKK